MDSKPGKQTGIQFSPPSEDLILPASNSMLKTSLKSPGCSECRFGRRTDTNLPPATISPYSSLSLLWASRVLLITALWLFRSLRHSSDDSRDAEDPAVNVSQREERKPSVPSNGRRKSVEARAANMRSRRGRVSVDRICIYSPSS